MLYFMIRIRKNPMLSLLLFSIFFFSSVARLEAQVVYECVERSELGPAWAGHPVGFALLTQGEDQFAAFYDEQQNMTLAQRKISDKNWKLKRLPSKIGWDSHNYITIILDHENYLHVAGNMHCVPLIYFRSEKPLDIESLTQISEMVGTYEKRCTYPLFFFGPADELLFTYRDGGSGNGSQIWNEYDLEKKLWKRMLDKPLFDGQNKMNAYFRGPQIGPDGYYHLSWMWRDTPDCSTNHDFSYARSKNLRDWENSRGEKVELPITLQTGEIVDAAQPKEGLLNPNQCIGFDNLGRVVLSYSKYDKEGNYQLYNVRLEDGKWKYYQTSSWNYRWEFQGGGSIIGEVGFGPVTVENGKLVQTYRHIKAGSGRWELDKETLKPISSAPSPVRWPKEVNAIELDFPGIQRRTAWDIRDQGSTTSGEPEIRYVMRWESLQTNRDRPHPQAPPPSTLRVLKMKKKTVK